MLLQRRPSQPVLPPPGRASLALPVSPPHLPPALALQLVPVSPWLELCFPLQSLCRGPERIRPRHADPPACVTAVPRNILPETSPSTTGRSRAAARSVPVRKTARGGSRWFRRLCL